MEKHSALIAAVLTLLAALLSVALVFVSADRTEARVDVEGLQQDVGALEEQVNRRDGTIATLNETLDEQAAELSERDARIAQLEASLGDQGRPVPAPSDQPVRHQGTVTLADYGDRIDLMAPASDALWSAGQVGQNRSDSLWYAAGEVWTQAVDAVRLDGAQATYAACSSVTGYADAGGTDPATLEAGDTCLRLSDGSFATMRASSITRDAITLEITTWQGR